jgi:hypothetical protein
MGTGDTQVAEAAAEQGIGAVGVAQGGDAAFASLLARHANSVAAQETRGGVGTASSPPGVEVRLSVVELSRSRCDGRSASRTRRR